MRVRIYLGFSVLFLTAVVGWAGPLDESLVVTSREDVLAVVAALQHKLTAQENLDVGIAITCFSVECSESNAPRLTKEERDLQFVSLIDRRSPRQIILEAAALMRARYGSALRHRVFAKSERGVREWLITQVSQADLLTHTYANGKKG